MTKPPNPTRTMTEGQRAYERKRAEKAGMSLEKWTAAKQRDQAQAERAQAERARASAPVLKPAKPGLLARLLNRMHQPLKPRG